MRIKRNILEYFLIRQEFIAPSFQPTFTESFLREDFDFSNYLLRYKFDFLTHVDFIIIFYRCLGDLGKKVFKINGVSVFILLLLIAMRVSIVLID